MTVRKGETEREWTDLLCCKTIRCSKAFDVVCIVTQCMNLVCHEVEQFEVRVVARFRSLG